MPPRLCLSALEARRAESALKVSPLVTHHSDHRAARDIVIGRAERMLSYRILLCRIVSYRIVLSRVVSCPVVFYVYCICIVCALYRVVCALYNTLWYGDGVSMEAGPMAYQGEAVHRGGLQGGGASKERQGGGGALHCI